MDSQNTPGEPLPRDVPYRSFLMRLWRTDRDVSSGWRASLEDPRTGQRFGFASLEQLFAFVLEQLADDTPPYAHSSQTT